MPKRLGTLGACLLGFAMGGLLAALIYARLGLSLAFFAWLSFGLCLMAVAIIDFTRQLIPMVLVYPTMAVGLLLAAIDPSVSLASALFGGALGWGFLKLVATGYKAFRGREGLGSGDPPLLGLIGVFLGYQATPLVMGLAALLALAAIGAAILTGRHAPGATMAFGPFLALAAGAVGFLA